MDLALEEEEEHQTHGLAMEEEEEAVEEEAAGEEGETIMGNVLTLIIAWTKNLF